MDTQMTEPMGLWLVRAAGAAVGSGISLAYILPRGRREAALRFLVGMTSGLAFGGLAGMKIADELGIDGTLNAVEVALAGATFASLSAWWALGLLMRFFEFGSIRRLGLDRSDSDDGEERR